MKEPGAGLSPRVHHGDPLTVNSALHTANEAGKQKQCKSVKNMC